MIATHFQQIKPIPNPNHEARTTLYLQLVGEKYVPEYKIDRATRSKAESILNEYFKAFPEDLKVIAVYFIF